MAMVAVKPEGEDAEGVEALLDSARSLTEARDRVLFIRDLMLQDVWHKRLLAPLADVWKCAASTVRNYSAEASRHIKASLNKPLLRARFLDKLESAHAKLDRAYEVAELELHSERGSPAKASEAMTKASEGITRAVLAAAQLSGVATEEKAVPHLTINVGQPVTSPIMDELMGADEPKAITVHGEPVPEADAAVVVSAGVGPPPEVSDDDDDWRG